MIKVRGVGKLRRAIGNLQTGELNYRRHIWRRLHNSSGHTTPAFLVGCGRSGTTMLGNHLSRSWRIEFYNENHPEAFERWRMRDFGVIEQLVEKSYADVALFKPLLNTYQTRAILSKFPDCRVIFAFRHYDDVINSSLKRFGIQNRLNHVRKWVFEDFKEFEATPPPPETKGFIISRWKPELSPESGAALYWLFQNRLFFDLGLAEQERVKLILYESVVANPVQEFRSITQHIGIPFESLLANGVFSSVGRDSPPQFDPQIRVDCEELWQRMNKLIA